MNNQHDHKIQTNKLFHSQFALEPQIYNFIMGKTGFLLHLMAVAVLLSCSFMATLSVEYYSSNITTDELALIALKEQVTHDPRNLLAINWSSSTLVCNWIGVTCGSFSKNRRVTALNLSHMGLTGTIPPHLGNLSFLAKFDINNNDFHGSIPKELANLSRLNYIDFNKNGFGGEIPSWFGSFAQLQYLSLKANNFTGSIPSSIFNTSSLQVIELGFNKLSFHLSSDTFDHLPMLQNIGLTGNQVSGRIPISLFKCKHLERMSFAVNQLEGSVPIQIGNLTSLRIINLHNNYLEDFSDNGCGGEIPSWFGSFTQLQILNLMMGNNFTGSIPSSIFNTSSLQVIELGFNKLSFYLSSDTFDHLPMLQGIGLSGNQVSGRIPISLFKCKHLEEMHFADNQLEGSVPIEIGNLTSLWIINLHNNYLEGIIPWSIGHLTSLKMLMLSKNNLTGVIPSTIIRGLTSLTYLDLSSNSFTGTMPTDLPPSLLWFILSENRLVGEIPPLICNLSSLQVLDVSQNNLGGTIPKCLGNLSTSLLLVNLYMNNFHGQIPVFPKNCSLISLQISNNQFEGPIPQSLVNCKDLNVLDAWENHLNDTFPWWLGNLKNLEIVVLRSNRLHGHIVDSQVIKSSFSLLRIIDLSHNDFHGHLPSKLFENLHAVISIGDFEEKGEAKYMEYYNNHGFGYLECLSLTAKGLDMEYTRILTTLTAIDFSNNRFNGELPIILGELQSLRVLNLSRNSLTGSIPSSLSNLSKVESLDLSSNKLQGRIPAQLKNLISLEALNLSWNNLTGLIPQGNQLDTFTNDSYIGNLGLCGLPLSKSCIQDDNLKPHKKFDDTKRELNWKFSILMGYGCGLVFGLSMGYIMFTTGKPWRFIRIIERLQQKFVGKI